MTESAVDGDVLRCDEVAEGCVRVVAGEGAVGAGGVAVLMVVRTYFRTAKREWTYPKTDQDVLQWFAGVDVDHADVQFKWDADLLLC